ncbi:MAG: Clp protease N-terminal domain-containing protein, partial [Pyrinomonadaceae bacterium]
MTNPDAYKDKFGESGRRVLENAINESRRRQQNRISVEHVLNALAEEEKELFNQMMRDLSIDPRSVRLSVEKRLQNSPRHSGSGTEIANDATTLFKRSLDRAKSQSRRTIEASDMFFILSTDERGLLNEILQNLGIGYEEVERAARMRIKKREQDEERSRKKYELPSYLKHFGVSMNKLARQDKIPPTIGRELEIRQMIEILSHRERSNSPMLVGEPGVGKTAVVEGLARLIELEPEKVPERLRNSHIVQLQMGGLVAGT